MTAAATIKDINLNNLGVFEREEAHELLRALRRESPVHWNEGDERTNGFWSITKYNDILQVSRHPEIFANATARSRARTDARAGSCGCGTTTRLPAPIKG